jgi:hypothetical protein
LIVVAAVYAVISARFWFRVPTVGILLAVLLMGSAGGHNYAKKQRIRSFHRWPVVSGKRWKVSDQFDCRSGSPRVIRRQPDPVRLQTKLEQNVDRLVRSWVNRGVGTTNSYGEYCKSLEPMPKP